MGGGTMGSSSLLTQSSNPSRIASRLRTLVEDAVERCPADGILLSGGLDTSILSAISRNQARRLKAVSVAVADAGSPDEPFAKMVAESCGFELRVLRPTLADLVSVMPSLIRVLRVFDPMELRNSVVTWLGLSAAREWGIQAMLTGDAADELFAGYGYITSLSPEQLRPYLDFLNGVMRFSSQVMAPAVGIQAQLPYLDPAVREFALTLSYDDLIVERDGRVFGKKALRDAFADLLPADIIWRIKTPIEYGSGSHRLQEFVIASIPDDEFDAARVRVQEQESVSLRDKEHYFYYRIYRTMFPTPREQGGGAKRCKTCSGAVERTEQRYCFICGAYPC
jgi:asparagine synthase (glutamine-hydrolysing)